MPKVAAAILEASGGRLSPFKPVADDDGMEFCSCSTSRPAGPFRFRLSARRVFDNEKAKTVEFDIRLKTFARKGDGYVLCVKLAGASIETAWLIPADELEGVARQSSTDFIVVASAKPTSNDRFSRYRASSFGEIPARILTPRAG